VGFYDPIKDRTHLDLNSIRILLKQGAQPSDTVRYILQKTGILNEQAPGGIL
jgi:ribosomal protein S16